MRPLYFLSACFLLLCVSPALAQDGADERPTLTAHGGARFVLPEADSWKALKREADHHVYEQRKQEQRQIGVNLLILGIEPGPSQRDTALWQQVQANIIAEASSEHRQLTLDEGRLYDAVEGFDGRLFQGQLKEGDRALSAAIIVLAQEDRFLTVSLFSDRADSNQRRLLDEIAAKARLGSDAR